MTTIVIGGDYVGPALADRLREAGPVVFLADCPETVERVRDSGVDGHLVDPTNRRDLETVLRDPATTAVVSTNSDSVNLLIAQHLRTTFDVDRIVVRVNDPRNREAFADREFETVSVSDALADSLREAVEGVERPRERTVVDSTQ